MSAFYEVFPHNNDMKKNFDKKIARVTNLQGMKKLWDHLKATKQVARGSFCLSSKGFIGSDAYLRAVEFGNHWEILLGVFKEEMIFQHLNEEVPDMPAKSPVNQIKRLKMV